MEDEIAHLSKLCRIRVTDEEKKMLEENLNKVLKYVELLDEVDTTDVPHCLTVVENASNVTREDAPEEPLAREVFLKEAPAQVAGMVKVPTVMGDESL